MIFKDTDEIHLNVEIDNTEIAVTVAGGFFNLPGTGAARSRVHSHASYELHSILEGEAVLECDTEEIHLREGESCIITPGTVHKSISVRDGGVKVSFSFFFEELKRQSSIDTYKILKTALGGKEGVITLGKTPAYSLYLKRTIAEFYSESPWSEARLKARFLLLLTEIIADLERMSDTAHTERKKRSGGSMYNLTRSLMEEYVTRSYNKSPSLKELSDVVHLSQKQTARLFRRYFTDGFARHIVRLRTDAAKYLLRTTSLSLREIASRVGYTSYNGLLKSFTDTVGMTPSAYREERRKSKN